MKNPKSRIKFAFFGTPKLAAVMLDELEKSAYIPAIVVTAPDRPKGRGLALAKSEVKSWAQKRNIPVLQPEKLDDAFVRELKGAHCDLFIVIYYGKIIPRAVLDIPKHGTLNIHFSLLPRFRGTSPVRSAILNDERNTGISIILLDEKIDHGPIIAQKKIPPPAGGWPPRASELEEISTRESAELLIKMLPSWIAGEIDAHEQNHDVATYCENLTKEAGLINLSDDAYKNLLKIRAFDSTIGTHAFFERNGKKVRVGIVDAHIKNNLLAIETVKPEGKREMKYEEFLRSGAKPFE